MSSLIYDYYEPGVLSAEKTSNELKTIAMCVSCAKEWDLLRMVKLLKSEMVILNN